MFYDMGTGSVSKSFVKGVGWKPATALTARQRGLVAGSHAAAKGMSRGDKAFLKSHTNAKQAIAGMDLKPGVHPGWGNQAGTYRIGGKRGHSLVVGEGTTKKIRGQLAAHENEHAKVKRSSYRLHAQIGKNPEKLFREEARADFHSVGHYAKGKDATGSVYGTAARYREKALKQPNRPGRGTKALKDYGIAPRRYNNSELYVGSKMRVQQAMPHYPLGGKKGDAAVDAYRGLQNHLRDVSKALPFQGMGAALGSQWATRTANAAERIAPKAASAGYKGRRKLPKQGALVKLNRKAKAGFSATLKNVSHDATKLATLGHEALSHTVYKAAGEHDGELFLDMGGAQVTEERRREIPVRDVATGRFVATARLQRQAQGLEALIHTRENSSA